MPQIFRNHTLEPPALYTSHKREAWCLLKPHQQFIFQTERFIICWVVLWCPWEDNIVSYLQLNTHISESIVSRGFFMNPLRPWGHWLISFYQTYICLGDTLNISVSQLLYNLIMKLSWFSSDRTLLSKAPCKVPTSTSGTVQGSVSCLRTLWYADQGKQTSDPPMTRCWLHPWAIATVKTSHRK